MTPDEIQKAGGLVFTVQHPTNMRAIMGEKPTVTMQTRAEAERNDWNARLAARKAYKKLKKGANL